MLGRALVVWCAPACDCDPERSAARSLAHPALWRDMGAHRQHGQPVRGHRPLSGLYDWLDTPSNLGRNLDHRRVLAGSHDRVRVSRWSLSVRASLEHATSRLQPVAGSHLDCRVGSDGGRASRGGSNSSSVPSPAVVEGGRRCGSCSPSCSSRTASRMFQGCRQLAARGVSRPDLSHDYSPHVGQCGTGGDTADWAVSGRHRGRVRGLGVGWPVNASGSLGCVAQASWPCRALAPAGRRGGCSPMP